MYFNITFNFENNLANHWRMFFYFLFFNRWLFAAGVSDSCFSHQLDTLHFFLPNEKSKKKNPQGLEERKVL